MQSQKISFDPYRQHRFCFTVCIDGEILAGTRLEQQFTVQSDRMTGFSVLCGTFGRQNSGKLHMALYEQTDSDEKILIEDFAVDVSHMQDNAWQVMQLTEPLENAAGKNLLLECPHQTVHWAMR